MAVTLGGEYPMETNLHRNSGVPGWIMSQQEFWTMIQHANTRKKLKNQYINDVFKKPYASCNDTFGGFNIKIGGENTKMHTINYYCKSKWHTFHPFLRFLRQTSRKATCYPKPTLKTDINYNKKCVQK